MNATNKSHALERLENNEVDSSLVFILPATLTIEKLNLIQNKLYLVGNTEQKFKKSTYTKEIFKELPLIYIERRGQELDKRWSPSSSGTTF